MALQYSHQFEAIGTVWAIETDTALSAAETRVIEALIHDFDATYSRFRDDSLVSHAKHAAPGSFIFPDSIALLYDAYTQLETITHGAVNPLVGATLEHLGYDATYSLRPIDTVPFRPSSLADTITRSGTTLTYTEPALLDVGAIGKGYLVDQVATYLAKHHAQYVVDAGGDMTISTATPYVVGLEHPLSLSQVIGTVSLQHQSICASSPNRRTWGEGLHHIIDGRTGQPAETDIIATWAIAPTTLLADALTTALFFVPASILKRHFGEFHHAIMRADSSVEHSLGDEAILFTSEK